MLASVAQSAGSGRTNKATAEQSWGSFCRLEPARKPVSCKTPAISVKPSPRYPHLCHPSRGPSVQQVRDSIGREPPEVPTHGAAASVTASDMSATDVKPLLLRPAPPPLPPPPAQTKRRKPPKRQGPSSVLRSARAQANKLHSCTATCLVGLDKKLQHGGDAGVVCVKCCPPAFHG